MDSPTLLCVDDRPQMLELRKAALESKGYCVKLASSGYTAIKTLEETSVAAVPLEYKQEGMDAEAIACHIKQRFPNLPIICSQPTPRCQSESCGWWMTMS
jgi:CheY-like chemotaxis protein